MSESVVMSGDDDERTWVSPFLQLPFSTVTTELV